MGRPPSYGAPVFRFTPLEVVEMEACLQEINNTVPPREVISSLADKFSASAERAGKIVVQPKQVWNWFQNRRYAIRAKTGKEPGRLSVPSTRDDGLQLNAPPPVHVPASVPVSFPVPAAKNPPDHTTMEFEAKSARDGAWYDVASFISHRLFETCDPEVRVHFTGFGVEEDEWVKVMKCVRQRSLPCETNECTLVLDGDLILCFQEGKEQALYFDAHVLGVQRRRHDARGCRCRFLVCYDHDQSEEIVALRKICRRPETDYRLQMLQGTRVAGQIASQSASHDPHPQSSTKESNLASQKPRKQRKLMDVNTDEVTTVPFSQSTDPVLMEPVMPPPVLIATEGQGKQTVVSAGSIGGQQ